MTRVYMCMYVSLIYLDIKEYLFMKKTIKMMSTNKERMLMHGLIKLNGIP